MAHREFWPGPPVLQELYICTPDWVAQGQPIWLPYAQMKTATPPLPVVRSHGSRLELADRRSLIDGVASGGPPATVTTIPIAQAVRASSTPCRT